MGYIVRPGFYTCNRTNDLTLNALVMKAGGTDPRVKYPLQETAVIYLDNTNNISSDYLKKRKVRVERDKWDVPLRKLGVNVQKVQSHAGEYIVVEINQLLGI